MSEHRFRIEHWHLDEVSVLGFSEDVTAGRYRDLLRAAHASGVVVVIAEGATGIVGRYPLWPVDGDATIGGEGEPVAGGSMKGRR